MLNFVPLARPRWQVANRNGEFELVGEFLQLQFPETYTVAVTPAAISSDQQSLGLGMPSFAHSAPPPTHSIDSEGSGIVIRPDTDPSSVVVDVVNPKGNCAA